MKKYWLLLDTYSFIWHDSKEIVIYNSLSGNGFSVNGSQPLERMINELSDLSNLYCTEVNQNEMEEPCVKNFVKLLRHTFSGDIYDQDSFPERPVVIVPKINMNDDANRDMSEIYNLESLGQKVLNNLLELTIQLTGKCDLNCVGCQDIFKQLAWCIKGKHEFDIDDLTLLLNQVIKSNIRRINFIGGNIFHYASLNKCIEQVKTLTCVKNFCFHYNQLPLFERHFFAEDPTMMVTVFVDDLQGWENDLTKKLEDIAHNFIFKITSVEEYQKAFDLIREYGLQAKMLPYFTGSNTDFFQEHIFLDKKAILTTQWSKKDIFSHQLINSNYFGHFTILANGDVFANKNLLSIGNVKKENLNSLVYKELKNGNAWRYTRDNMMPCKKCLYKYLCPPISNYEFVMKRNDLCKT